MSQLMIDYLMDSMSINLSTGDAKFVKQLITGHPPSSYSDRWFLYDIIANQRNSVDVDKMTTLHETVVQSSFLHLEVTISSCFNIPESSILRFAFGVVTALMFSTCFVLGLSYTRRRTIIPQCRSLK